MGLQPLSKVEVLRGVLAAMATMLTQALRQARLLAVQATAQVPEQMLVQTLAQVAILKAHLVVQAQLLTRVRVPQERLQRKRVLRLATTSNQSQGALEK